MLADMDVNGREEELARGSGAAKRCIGMPYIRGPAPVATPSRPSTTHGQRLQPA